MKQEIEVVDLGVDNCQYFQGFGTSFTPYTDSVVGAGWTAREAIEDALEQMAQVCTELDFPAAEKEVWSQVEFPAHLDKTVAEIMNLEVPEEDDALEDCELYYYIGIRWKVEETFDEPEDLGDGWIAQ